MVHNKMVPSILVGTIIQYSSIYILLSFIFTSGSLRKFEHCLRIYCSAVLCMEERYLYLPKHRASLTASFQSCRPTLGVFLFLKEA
uniref:Uncharacterized protein n=1 Tax=Setaria italica TaxID=4555 RepID=K3ZKM5_SETIT